MSVFDQPIMEQLEELYAFCNKHKSIYIYGTDYNQLMIEKYLKMSGVTIDGFLLPKVNGSRMEQGIPVIAMNNVLHRIDKSAGVIISTEDGQYNVIIKSLQKKGVTNYFFVSEYNKRTISHKMTPRARENFLLEMNIADHCNLNCQMCDHFSPIAEKTFYGLDVYERDMTRIAELTGGKIGLVKIQGGEPLLSDDLIEYIKISRRLFPDSRIWLFTAGVLLLKWENHKNGNLWSVCKEYNIEIQLTKYPVKLDFGKMEEKASEYGVTMLSNTNIGDLGYTGTKFSVRHPFDLTGNQEPYRWISCYQLNESITMNHGKIYTCPMIPYVKHFNKYFDKNLEVGENDYIDIYEAKSFEEIAEFCTHRTDFCRYCATHKRTQHEWKQSKHTMDEWVL